MDVSKISIGQNPPKDVNVIIEIAEGQSPVKYELDKDSGALFVDRIIHTEMRYPCNYGFVPHTLSEDGDPIDVLVVSGPSFMPASVVRCRPVGVLMMEDQKGPDEKILAVPVKELHPYYNNVKHYDQLPEILLKKIRHFFEHYKDLEEGKWTKIDGWGSPERAQDLMLESIERAKKDIAA